MYEFLVRIKLPSNTRLNIEGGELKLSNSEDPNTVMVVGETSKISDSEKLKLVGTGYHSMEQAEIAANHWKDIFSILLLRNHLGVDYNSNITNDIEIYDKQYLESGEIIYTEDRTEIYKTPRMTHKSIKCNTGTGKNIPNVETQISLIKSNFISFTDKERLAFHLYSAAFFITEPYTRFLQIFMALETLASQEERSHEVQSLIIELKNVVEASNLSQEHKISLNSGLNALTRESMRKSILSLLLGFESKEYDGKSFSKIVRDSYTMRNEIVHGSHTRPPISSVNDLIFALEYVSRHINAEILYQRKQIGIISTCVPNL